MRAAASLVPLVLLLAACAGSAPKPTALPEPSDPADLIARSLEATESLESYRMEITFSPDTEPLTTIVDFERPDRYHYLFSLSDSPDEITEVIYAGEDSFGRFCPHYPDDCDRWDRDERPPIASLGGLTTFVPETLSFVALDLATDARSAFSEEIDDQPVYHLQASLNLSSAICENQRRAFEAAQLEDPNREEECGAIDFDAVPASTLDVWISPDDMFTRRLRIGNPGFEEDPYLEVAFSLFGGASIEAPF